MSQPAYLLRAVRYGYGVAPVLRLDALQIEAGAVTALLGANGSGKSTLLDMLAFLRTPGSGEIHFFGAAVPEKAHPSLRRRIAYVQQRPYLFNTSVRRNIELGLKLRGVSRQSRRAAVEQVTEQCHLEHLLQRPARELSGGEVQKVALARALVLAPEVLLLDEPFSHLDVQFRQELEHLLRRMRQAQAPTVVLSSHEPLQARGLAEHIISLDQGRAFSGAALNLFRGMVDRHRAVFDTGRIQIHIPPGLGSGEWLAIAADQLRVSRERCPANMPNSYSGRLVALREEGEDVGLIIEAGEAFHATLSPAAFRELGLQIGATVWVSFAPTAVRLSA